ncbi:MAG: modification methylase [Oceanospirillaceae bacterium]|nr:modification methylase [Oceanospirillaceae bacterium]
MNISLPLPLETNSLDSMSTHIDSIRIRANSLLDESKRGQMGQFMTPSAAARLLADMFRDLSGDIKVLDAGAGVGSLTGALIERALESFSPNTIEANAWELDSILVENLHETLEVCEERCQSLNVSFGSKVNSRDFIEHAVALLKLKESGEETLVFNKAILNPPYLKISAKSKERELLRSVGVEAGNLYSCFVALAIMLLEKGGELVAITPRSFCNGPYFNDFRRILLSNNNLTKLHVFESRTKAFKEDKVLQENVVFHIVKGEEQGAVDIVSSTCADDPKPSIRRAEFKEVVNPHNPNRFIHIVTNDEEAFIAKRIGGMPCSLEDLGIEASTGKVVDFRTRENLRYDMDDCSVPLIYPMHFKEGAIEFPIPNCKKPNAILLNESTKKLMVPNGTYVITKRLTAKEEKRRIVASLYSPDVAPVDYVGFENKTNYFHSHGEPLEEDIAKGLWVYLNSTAVDKYFRQFNGHTQVNSTDLRVLRYPTKAQLRSIAQQVELFDQVLFDQLIDSL